MLCELSVWCNLYLIVFFALHLSCTVQNKANRALYSFFSENVSEAKIIGIADLLQFTSYIKHTSLS